MPQPKRKPIKRTHLPRLNPLEIEAFQARLMAESGISAEGKNAVMLSLRAAANPRAETPDVVINTLEADEKTNVLMAMPTYQQILGAPGMRGRNRLMMDLELDAMIASEGDE